MKNLLHAPAPPPRCTRCGNEWGNAVHVFGITTGGHVFEAPAPPPRCWKCHGDGRDYTDPGSPCPECNGRGISPPLYYADDPYYAAENVSAPPPPWKDETDRCPQCGTVHPALAAKDARIAALERIIEEAAHGPGCVTRERVLPCNCWKSEARAR